jgi:hypothetical protein
MPKGMAARRLQYARLANRALHSPLRSLFVLMRTCRVPRIRVLAKRVCGKNPLPAPLSRGIRILARKRRRQPDTWLAQPSLALKASVLLRQMLAQRRNDRCREHSHSILTALGITHDDLAARKKQILDPQLMRLHQAQPAAVEEIRNEPTCAVDVSQYRANLRSTQNHWQSLRPESPRHVLEPRQVDLDHLPIKKKKSLQSLILSGRRDFGLNGEVSEEGLNLLRPPFRADASGRETSHTDASIVDTHARCVTPDDGCESFHGPPRINPAPPAYNCPRSTMRQRRIRSRGNQEVVGKYSAICTGFVR